MNINNVKENAQCLVLMGLLLISMLAIVKASTVDEYKFQQLKSTIQQAKIFPDDIVTTKDFMGDAVAIDSNRALVGAPKLSKYGVVYVYDYVGGVWQETAILEPEGAQIADRFGLSVSLDGDVVLIGAPNDTDKGNNAGAAYVFELTGGDWIQKQKLVANDGAAGHNFGWSVSLKSDFALIGTKYDFTVNDPGAAYVFKFNNPNDIWQQRHKLTASDGFVGNRFGSSVSLSATHAFIGTSGDDDNGTTSGAVYVYSNHGSWGFPYQTKLLASDGSSGDFFGGNVSAGDDRVLIGARNDDNDGFSQSGSAFVFDFDGTDWSETAKLTASDQDTNNYFGGSVSLKGDLALIGSFGAPSATQSSPGAVYLYQLSSGWTEIERFNATDNSANDSFGTAVAMGTDLFIVGDSYDDDNGDDAGAAYIFGNNTGWQQEAKLISSLGPYLESYGSAVSIEGTRAVVGAPNNDVQGINAGSVYVFDYDAGSWHFTQQIFAADGSDGDWFGTAVSLSGNRLLVGAPGVNEEGTNAGAAYVFDLSGGVWSQSKKLLVSSLNAHDRFGTSVDLDADRILIGAYGVDLTGINLGAAYIFDWDGDQWTFSTELTASDGANLDSFAEAVSLDGNRAIVSASRDDDGSNDSGSVYVFDFDNGMWSESDKLTAEADASANALFGNTLVLDNDTVLVGAYHDNVNAGAAFVFEYDNQSMIWNRIQKLTADNSQAGNYFGTSLSLDDNIIIIGAPGSDNNGNESGSAYVFQKISGSWQQTENIVANDGSANHKLGQAVSLSSELIVIGAPHADGHGKESGAAYIFNVDILPVAVDDYVSTDEDTYIEFFPLANDTDSDGGANSIISVSDPYNGTVFLSSPQVTYVPNSNYCNDGISTDDFTYTLNGGSTATIYVTVVCVDENPVAVDDAFVTDEDVSKNLDVLANDYDPDSDHNTISIQSITQPANGFVENLTTSLKYTPNTDYCNDGNTTDDFTYELNGGWEATVEMTVNCVDDAAIAENDYDSMNEDQTILLDVTANDTDADGGVPFEIIGFTQPQFGLVSNESGNLRYAPNLNYCNDGAHVDDFEYTITGGDSATVEVTVYCVNDQPNFSHLGNITTASISSHLIENWAYDYDFGASNENFFQEVLQFNLQIVSDSNNVIDLISLDISLDGDLMFTTTGQFGTAILEISMQDDGGTASGGVDTSEIKSFTITFDDTIFANGFENNGNKQAIQDYLAKVAQSSSDYKLPYYDAYTHVVVFHEFHLELDSEFFTATSLQALKSWLSEILKLNHPWGDFDSVGIDNELDDEITIH